jgi:hypothetical protein
MRRRTRSHDRPSREDAAVPPAHDLRLAGGLLATTSSDRRWALSVAFSCAVGAALAAAGLPGALGWGLALAWAVIAIADVVVGLIAERFERVGDGVDAHRVELERMLFDEYVDGPTHGSLFVAREALVVAQTRFARQPAAPESSVRAVSAALADIERIETDLKGSKLVRSAWRGKPPRPSGGYAASVVDGDPAVLIKTYGDPANLPDWLGPRSRDVVARVGAVLDDVRVLNTVQIEWAVLLFTLWARALLVCGAPWLVAVSVGDPPLRDGWSALDLGWALAAAWSVATALRAPWIATTVMRRDERGALLRRRLLVVEVPLSVVAIVCAPCWAVVVFAVGWTNWWQRPDFSWPRLALWMGLVLALLVTGAAIQGDGAGVVAAEFVIAMTVVAIIGAAYGAMLPVSATIMVRTLIGGLATPRRARGRADERIGQSIRHLLEAAREIEEHAPDDVATTRGVEQLRESAYVLGARADAGDRWARRTPLGLVQLMESALGDAGDMSDSPRAELLRAEAELSGEPEPVTLGRATYHERQLGRARFRKRRAARALRLLVTEVVREARRHGTESMITQLGLEGDRMVVRFANVVRDGPARPGRGNGAGNLRSLAESLPDGRLDVRGMVSGSFVDLPERLERFGVEVSFSREALDGIDEHPAPRGSQ